MQGLHQTENNFNHYSIKKNTLVKLKGLLASNYYKLNTISHLFWKCGNKIFQITSIRNSKQHGKYQY